MHLVVLDSVGNRCYQMLITLSMQEFQMEHLIHLDTPLKSSWVECTKHGKTWSWKYSAWTSPWRLFQLRAIQLVTQQKLEEVSLGKDTMTGHWEIMGLNITEPFDTFWNGFPEEILTKIEEFSGRKVIREANKPYSGTAVIDDFGPRQMETGELIIYTSADPVLQIAAHEDIIPLDELYRICEYARSIVWNVQLFLVGSLLVLMLGNQETSLVRPTVVTWLFHHLRQLFWTNWTKLVSIPMQLVRSAISSMVLVSTTIWATTNQIATVLTTLIKPWDFPSSKKASHLPTW